MLFNNPLSSERADQLIRLLGLTQADRVLDAGCGSGEFLLRVVETSGATGLGIDKDRACISAALAQTRARGVAGRCEFLCADLQDNALEPASFSVGICLGATHAFASGEAAYRAALTALGCLVRPGGKILIGEGYWKQDPAPEYLVLLGDPIGIYRDHAGNLELARRLDFELLFAGQSSREEWDAFESAHAAKIAHEAAHAPGDVLLATKLARSKRWYDGYVRWGRSTMGFGFYLFVSAPSPA
jgi:SAM-dependent methyltransferase